ncbi:MAG: SGNH/GDSL hydrolase family protein [Acidobacteria bacterium]|nr:SGNH/GDSL hydrolase family protein [Acidobacteriota bacterium]
MKVFGILLTIVLLFSTAAAADKRKVFVIGDSISIFYGPALKKYIGSRFLYDRKRDNGEALQDLDKPVGANGGDSRMVVEYLRKLQADKSFAADILLVNCGLHDIKTDPATGKKQIEPEEYLANLKTILKISKKMKLRLVWISSTPVDDERHNRQKVGFFRYNRDAAAYNEIARGLFEKAGVPIVDLYAFSREFPADAYADHIHYKKEYAELQAAFIAGFLLNSKF